MNRRFITILVAVAVLVIILAAVFLATASGPPAIEPPAGQQIEGLNGIEVGDR